MAGYSFQGQARPATICQGACTNLEAHLYEIIPTGPGQSSYSEVDLTGFTWQPGNLSGQYVNVCPTANTTYTASITYLGCVFTVTVGVSIDAISVSASPSSTVIPSGTAVNITSVVNPGVAPYTYLWTPNQFFSGGTTATQANPVLAPTQNMSYTLTVTDNLGCTAKTLVSISMPYYAVLKPELDGGYYQTIGGNVYFTVDGEYNTTALNYAVYNFQRNAMSGTTVSNSSLNYGDNRYALNVNSLASGYYVLEVVNQKNEKKVLRFLK